MTPQSDVPRGTLAQLGANWKADALSGFLVFLIALPLCLGIALACGYPAIAGVFTAIVGGILGSALSNSELTIKGPAAGLIVIVLGCVDRVRVHGGRDAAADLQAYRLALGVGVAAGVLQILFGVFRAGILGEFFPDRGRARHAGGDRRDHHREAVPGRPGPADRRASRWSCWRGFPEFIANMNPDIALIGVLGLVILFAYPLITNPRLKVIPAPMIVLLVAVPLGMYFDLEHAAHLHASTAGEYKLGPAFLVNVPANLFDAITFPDFSGIATGIGLKYIVLFALIGSLESLLSAKAVDSIDPWQRKTNLNRDLLAVGVGNTAGRADRRPADDLRDRPQQGQHRQRRPDALRQHVPRRCSCCCSSRWCPAWIHQIPLAALAAMLVYTGFRLASPQRSCTCTRSAASSSSSSSPRSSACWPPTCSIGIAIGIAVKFLIHFINGVPSPLAVPARHRGAAIGNRRHARLRDSAVFSNWMSLGSG